MRTGRYNRLIEIQRPLLSKSNTGAEVITWVKFLDVWAFKDDKPTASERTQSSTKYPVHSVTWVLRYTPSIGPEMRIVYQGQVWEITGQMDHDPRRRETRIVAQTRPVQDAAVAFAQKVENSNEVEFKDLTAFEAVIVLDDVPVTDDNGDAGSYAAPNEIEVDGVVDSITANASTGKWVVKIGSGGGFTPIRLLATTDTLYDEIETEPVGGEFTLPDFPVNILGSLVPISLPLDTLLNIVVAGYVSHTFITVPGVGSAITITTEGGTYRNSATPTFTQVINAGSVFTAPAITVTEVDGVTTRSEAPNEDITCAWVNIQVRSSDGLANVSGGLITAYPSGGNADVAFYRFRQPSGTQFGGNIPYRQSIQLMNADISDVTNSAGITQVTVTLPLNIPSDALWTAIKAEMTATQITAAEDDLCEVCPTPSGIAYPSITPATSYIDASASGHDTVALWQAGAYDITKPAYPTHIACLDKTDTARTTLVDNNFFGNKYRYTDTAGNPSSVGTTVPDRIDWVNHDWAGAVENIVIDHFFKCMYWVEYLTNGTRYSMQNTSIGDTWYNWLDFIDGLTIGGYSDWLPIPMDTRLPHAAHANQGETSYSNFFIAYRTLNSPFDGRCGFVTGESLNATNYYPFRDSGNLNLITAGTGGDGSSKASESGFTASITLIYCMRMLTDADVTALTA